MTRNPILLMPWGLISIVGILSICFLSPRLLELNWHWLVILLIFPTAVLENIKTGFSSMRVMFVKLFYTLLSFLIVGISIGAWAMSMYYPNVPTINLPPYVLLAIGVVLLIEFANVFSLLKAVKREFGSFDG